MSQCPPAPPGDGADFAPRRLDCLRQMAREARVVRVRELCARLRVSPATVRRDLAELERRGELRRVHGGAVCEEGLLEEPRFEDKASLASAEKRRIAQAALGRVKNGDTLFLDGGSTVLELARMLRGRRELTVVTNSLQAALELAPNGPRLILVGGELRRLSRTFVGPLTGRLLSALHIDRAFMGTLGLTLADGPSTTDPGEAHTKELVMGRAREVYLLADGSKIGKASFVRSGGWDKIDALITDRSAPRSFARALARRGVRVVRA